MMEHAVLQRIENDQPVERDSPFLYVYQRAVLQELQNSGTLTDAQYQEAYERLRSRVKAIPEERS